MRTPSLSDNNKFSLTLLLALLLHGAMLAVTFEFEDPPMQRLQRALEITLVRHPKPPKINPNPDYLAQRSQQGSGEQKKNKPPKSGLTQPAPAPSNQASLGPDAKAAARETDAKQPAAKSRRIADKPKRKKHSRPPAKPTVRRGLQLSADQDIQRLTMELDRKMDVFSKRPRRKYVSASTQEYKYAAYLQAWRKKVERVGTLNFPDEAKRKKLYGNLVLQVSLNADGTIRQIELRKSSGHKVLDDAAIRIVRIAAPFAPFPANIAEEADILDITRTWQFVSGRPLFKTK